MWGQMFWKISRLTFRENVSTMHSSWKNGMGDQLCLFWMHHVHILIFTLEIDEKSFSGCGACNSQVLRKPRRKPNEPAWYSANDNLDTDIIVKINQIPWDGLIYILVYVHKANQSGCDVCWQLRSNLNGLAEQNRSCHVVFVGMWFVHKLCNVLFKAGCIGFEVGFLDSSLNC